MAKKIPVANSPWGRDYERVSDCDRWIKQGHAGIIDGALHFTKQFVESVTRAALEADPTGYDDGVPKRWTTVESGKPAPSEYALNGNLIDGRLIVTSQGGLPVQQLRPIKQVGTGSAVSKFKDMLTRRQPRRGPVISLMSPA